MNKQHYIAALLTWIDAHLEEPLSLDDISEKSGYSKRYLQALFKQETENTLGDYVRKRRLGMAAQELRGGTTPILDVAIKYHYNCQQSFTRAFKREYRITPALFRRTHA